MDNYYRHLLLQVKRFIFLLVLYTASRLFFYLLNTSYFSDLSFWRLIGIFGAGIRFDIVSIALINVVFFLIAALPGGFKNNRSFQKVFDITFFQLMPLPFSVILSMHVTSILLINAVLLQFSYFSAQTKMYGF